MENDVKPCRLHRRRSRSGRHRRPGPSRLWSAKSHQGVGKAVGNLSCIGRSPFEAKLSLLDHSRGHLTYPEADVLRSPGRTSCPGPEAESAGRIVSAAKADRLSSAVLLRIEGPETRLATLLPARRLQVTYEHECQRLRNQGHDLRRRRRGWLEPRPLGTAHG